MPSTDPQPAGARIIQPSTGFTEAQPTAAALAQSHEIASLVSRLRELGKPEAQPLWGRASANYDHMGAKLADAVLQSGVRYEAFVRPRVDRIASDYPLARTTSGFLELLRAEGPERVLALK